MTIKSRAAVAFGPNQPLQVVEVDVAPPQKGEVLVRIVATGVCKICVRPRPLWERACSR